MPEAADTALMSEAGLEMGIPVLPPALKGSAQTTRKPEIKAQAARVVCEIMARIGLPAGGRAEGRD